MAIQMVDQARVGALLVGEWLVEHAAVPKWIPPAWRTPWVSYALAAVVVTLAAFAETLYIITLPQAGLHSAPLLLVTAAVALTLGMGPSLVATALGAVWLEWAVLTPHFAWALNDPQQIVGLAVFCLAGAGIGTLAGRMQRARDRAEQLAGELVIEQGRLDAMLEAMPEPLVMLDEAGVIQRYNQAYADIGGTSPRGVAMEDLLRRYTLTTPQGEAVPVEQVSVMRALRGETVRDQEVSYASRTHRSMTVLASAAPFFDSHGRQLGAVMVAHDVTTLRRLERRTRESLDALLEVASGLMEQAPSDSRLGEGADPDVVIGPAARRLAAVTLRMLNCARAAVYRVNRETLAVTPVAVAGMDAAGEAWWWKVRREGFSLLDLPEMMRQRIEAGEVATLDTAEAPTLENPLVARVAAAAPMVADGELVGLLSLDYVDLATAQDADEQRLMMAVAQLAALVIERERLQRERGAALASALAAAEVARRYDEFLSVASHEIKTPVTVIDANLQLLDRQMRRAESASWVSEADREAMEAALAPMRTVVDRQRKGLTRLRRLTDDLLDVSRIREGRLEMRPEPCDALAVTRERFEEQRQLHPDRGLTLVIEPLDLEAAPMLADAGRIGQVVTNFLTNALKYSPVNGRITLTARVRQPEQPGAGRMFEVSVADEGQGIPRNEQERIWQAFHRVDGVKTHEGSDVGLGLGLHISKTIIERQGGAVGVESAPGQGARFWFTLPLTERAAQMEQA